ncbi:unnamed protein product [Alopecurus aequalis]
MLLVPFMALAAASEGLAHGHGHPVAPTHLHLYFHDTSSGPKLTAQKLRGLLDLTSQTMFGLVIVMDDPLTEGAKPGSGIMGRAQGLSLSVLGRNCLLTDVREMPVIGGTGAFRFARWYMQARINLFDLKTGNTIVEFDVIH